MPNPQTHATTVAAIRDEIREYIALNFLFDQSAMSSIDDDAPLLERGIVDPTGMVELALFLEDGYGIAVNEADLGPEHFTSVATIAAYVARRLGVRG